MAMKIAVITCYFDPDYVRARTIRTGFQADKQARVTVVKNQHRGLMRYPEIMWKLIQLRREQNPDVYVLTFRGQELLPFVLFLAGRRPVIFDEFIVPIAYARDEPHQASFATRMKHFLARVSNPFYGFFLRRSRVILADTTAHAELSARVSHVNLRQYRVLPVGTDETVFAPGKAEPREKFQVFYYSTGMQPLHGIGVVLEAAELLKDQTDIEFLIVGGKKPMERLVAETADRGAHVEYRGWIPFEELPATMRSAGLCLGGPFGDTPQAQHVITTKTYQSLACAAPTMVGASPATEEFFKDKENALVVPQADAEALSKAIAWAAKHRSELATIGHNGRKTYDKYFSSSVIAAQFSSVIDELAEA